jgi:hypothetical protein
MKNKDVYTQHTRQKKKSKQIPHICNIKNNKCGQKSIFCNGLKIYNKLDENTKKLDSKKFKEKSKSI